MPEPRYIWQTAKLPPANTRQRTAGRVVASIDFKEMILIPPIHMNQDGSLMTRSLEDLKRALKDRKAQKGPRQEKRGNESTAKVAWLKEIEIEEPPPKIRKLMSTPEISVKWKRIPHGEKIKALESTRSWPIIPDEIIGRIKPSKEWDNF